MEENTKKDHEKIISSFQNAMTNIYELQDDILSISEDTLDKVSSDVINKFHCFSTRELAHNFIILIMTFVQIRPLKTPLYGQLLSKISQNLAPFTTQEELMTLFSTNKLIVLYLLESNLITIEAIKKHQKKDPQYIYYFCNEIRKNDSFHFGKFVAKDEKLENFLFSISPEDHDKKRRIGLNDGEIETLIREDKLPESFIHPNHRVYNSIYENSKFLSNATYAEYAAYFGSLNFLKKFIEFDDIKMDKMLIYAIAGCQIDAFNFLLEQKRKKLKINHDCINASIEFHTTKQIEINVYSKKSIQIYKNDFSSDNFLITIKINGKQIKNESEIIFNDDFKKYVVLNDLYLSLKKLNWNFFIDNLLFLSDQINNPCDDQNFTLLHYACSMGYKEVVKLLLSLYCDKNYFDHDYEYDKNSEYIRSSDSHQSLIDVNVQDKYKRTPLHLAILNQKVEVSKILFKCDDTNFVFQDYKRKTVFHYAAETKNIEIVKLFIESPRDLEINLNIPDKKKNTALHYFCKPRCFDPSILTYVCNSKRVDLNNVNHKYLTELMSVVAKRKRNQILQVLVNCERFDLNFQTPERMETALMIASKYNNFEAAKILMNNIDRIDPNIQDFKLRTALHIAIYSASNQVFYFLIHQPSVNLNIYDSAELTPLFLTLYTHFYNYFEWMIKANEERKLNTDKKYTENNIDFEHRDHFSQNLLHYSIRGKYSTNLDLLLQMYSINEPDSKGTTAFHQACSIGCVNIIEKLIEKLGTTTDTEENNTIGLYNSSMDHNGISSIEKEEKKKVDDLKIARYKPGEKIRINQKDSNGLTPFHYACQCNSIETVNCLLSIPGIKFNEKDKKGETPFFYACKYEFVEIAKILAKTNQINPCTTNLNGISALSYLKEQDQKNIFL